MNILFAQIKNIAEELQIFRKNEEIGLYREETMRIRTKCTKESHLWKRNEYFQFICQCGHTVGDEQIYILIRNEDILNTKFRALYSKPFTRDLITDDLLDYFIKTHESSNNKSDTRADQKNQGVN